MTNETFNKLQALSSVLKNRFSELRSVTQGMYKVYNSESKFFDKSIMEVLEKFEAINLKKLYSEEILKDLPSQSEWFTNNLFKKENGELYISHDLENVIYYFLLNTYSSSIKHFLDFFENEQSNYNAFMFWDENKTKITIRRGVHETLFSKMNEIENSRYVWHLFNQVSNGIIYATNEFDFVIETEKIKKLLHAADEFKFKILNAKFCS